MVVLEYSMTEEEIKQTKEELEQHLRMMYKTLRTDYEQYLIAQKQAYDLKEMLRPYIDGYQMMAYDIEYTRAVLGRECD